MNAESSPKIDPSRDRVAIPVTMIPGFRTTIALQNGVEKNLLFRTWGGLGDQICAEPTLRFALRHFKGCKISLASEHPELFRHLKFDAVFDLKRERPIYERFLLLDTITPPDESNLVWQFFGHLTTNCVDFPSLCALRSMLPVAEKEVEIDGPLPDPYHLPKKLVVVHPGRHWPSKTFPKDWWDRVLRELARLGLTPVIIGGDTDDNRGTVDVDTTGCLDLRNMLSIMESVGLCQSADVVITNDSSPLHMAAARRPDSPAKAWILYVATCKHPDMITHWRNLQWGFRMRNLGKGGIWEHVDYCPNKEQKVTVDNVEEELLRSWLPKPEDVALCAYALLPV